MLYHTAPSLSDFEKTSHGQHSILWNHRVDGTYSQQEFVTQLTHEEAKTKQQKKKRVSSDNVNKVRSKKGEKKKRITSIKCQRKEDRTAQWSR